MFWFWHGLKVSSSIRLSNRYCVKYFPNRPCFNVSAVESFENSLGKADIARNEQFLFFSRRSLPFNPLPNDKILDRTKLKAFADDKLYVTKMIISVFDRVENIVGKGKIASTSTFFFSYNVCKRLLSQTRQKVSLCGHGLIELSTILVKFKIVVFIFFKFATRV